MNRKRVQRLWREEGLKVPRWQCKKRRNFPASAALAALIALRGATYDLWSYGNRRSISQ